MQLSRVRIIFYSLGLAVLALWITKQKESQQNTSNLPMASENSYNWQSSESTTWKINRNEPHQQTTMQTDIWRYQEATQQSEFTNPVITHTQTDRFVIITSQQGQTSNDENILLSGNVIIKQTTIDPLSANTTIENKTQNSILRTEHITYNANKGELETDAKVVITEPHGTTTATGLKANLETGQYQLLNDVQGTYNPNQP